ncbi:MAG: endonuclease III domain-containing protein [Candidatus Omnitrophota bacterium]
MPVDFMQIYHVLRKHFGHRDWWPGETRMEIIIGAILTQNTAWKNVEKAIANLKKEGALTYHGLSQISESRLAELIRSSGYFNQKAKKLKAFLHFLQKGYQGSLAKMFREETLELRRKLLEIKGVGPETADSILLYAGGHLSFVVDLYSYRVAARHGWIPEEIDYHGLRDFFTDNLPADRELYKDFHAQLVAVGNGFCRKTPKCEECPLRSFLPGGDPL